MTMRKRQIISLLLFFSVLCSLCGSKADADNRQNQISKSYLGKYCSGFNELVIYDISGSRVQFSVFFYRLHDQISTATLASDGAAYFSAPAGGGIAGKLEFIDGNVVLSIDDANSFCSYFDDSAVRFLGGASHWFYRSAFSVAQVPGLQHYNRVPFSAATATSELKEGDITFKAEYAIDGKTKYLRPWVEGVYGSGIGETLSLYFDKSTTIQAFSLRLGYARDQERYEKNNRPSTLRFTFSDGRSVDCWFEDRNVEQTILLSEAVSTRYVDITILDVYNGKQCDDTCIYEVKAFSP